jgi:hypothetical protein
MQASGRPDAAHHTFNHAAKLVAADRNLDDIRIVYPCSYSMLPHFFVCSASAAGGTIPWRSGRL